MEQRPTRRTTCGIEQKGYQNLFNALDYFVQQLKAVTIFMDTHGHSPSLLCA